MVGEVANTTHKDVRIGTSASALMRRGLRQPSHGLHGILALLLELKLLGNTDGARLSISCLNASEFLAWASL